MINRSRQESGSRCKVPRDFEQLDVTCSSRLTVCLPETILFTIQAKNRRFWGIPTATVMVLKTSFV